MAFTGLMRFISSLISVYMIILFIRILLTWFRGASLGRPYEILCRITDPYLNYFRRFARLKTARIDFSPLVAILVLVVVQNIFRTLATLGRITLGIVLSLIVAAGWSALSFLLTFLFVIILIRLLSLMISSASVSPLWQTLDYIINPVVEKIRSIIHARKPLSYQAELLITGISILILSIVGRIIMNVLILFLRNLPF